jgi:hypothetical protein
MDRVDTKKAATTTLRSNGARSRQEPRTPVDDLLDDMEEGMIRMNTDEEFRKKIGGMLV